MGKGENRYSYSSMSIEEVVCPICGKTFCPSVYHQWTIKKHWYWIPVCSYTCMRKWDREISIKNEEKTKKKTKKKKRNRRKTLCK